MLWNVTEQAMAVGLPRLLLFPVAAYVVGKEEFGILATALSIVLILGIQPANGLATGLLRNLALYDAQGQRQLVLTAVNLCRKCMLWILGVALVVNIGIFVSGLSGDGIFWCVTCLLLSLYAENSFMLLLTPLRYQRKFRQHALWYIASGVTVSVCGIIGACVGGIVGVAAGMLCGHAIVYGVAARRYGLVLTESNMEQAAVLKHVWLHLSIAGILAIAGPHLNRIVLRMYSDYGSVAELFAATSITYVFILPITNGSTLLLSFLSKYSHIEQISRHMWRMLLSAIIGGGAIATSAFAFAAPILSMWLFPEFGGDNAGLFRILIWMIPASIIVAFVRPMITKFAAVVWIPRINAAVLATTVLLMFGLIPFWGLEGAAWSITSGNIVAAILRTGVLMKVLNCARHERAKGRVKTECEKDVVRPDH